jgi:hypothetical protein
VSKTNFLVALASLALALVARAQTIGPDIVNAGLIDVTRYGTDTTGTITAYALGSTTCNHGDVPADVALAGSSVRPLVAMNLYRLKTDPSGAFARFEQLGQSWVKRVQVPIQGTYASCGSCVPGPSGTMGPGCADVYSSAFNGTQSLLGPRSDINATTGVSTGNPAPTGDPTTRGRIQVPTTDVTNQPAGTRYFAETVMVLPDDAQYVRPGQTIAINALNNASSNEADLNDGTANGTLIGPIAFVPAIALWPSIDPQVVVVTADHDDAANPGMAGTFIRARFYIAARVTSLGSGSWRYEYAIFNLNSDRAAGSFTLPLPAQVSLTDFSFHHPQSHSGEVYSNADWTAARSGNTVIFSTDSYTTDPNANAVRWGTSYNIGFTTQVPPATSTATLGLFKPGAPAGLAIEGLPVPTVRTCSADFDGDGAIGTDSDIDAFFNCLAGNCCPLCEGQDFNGDGAPGTDADIESFFRVLAGQPC